MTNINSRTALHKLLDNADVEDLKKISKNCEERVKRLAEWNKRYDK